MAHRTTTNSGLNVERDTLIQILAGRHFNMPERIAMGVWPHPPIRYEEVITVLAEHLREFGCFPRPTEPTRPGNVVREGGTIQKLGPQRYLYRSQRSDPLNPRILRESGERFFTTAEEAARYYLHWDLRLPGDLDGWKVIGSTQESSS